MSGAAIAALPATRFSVGLEQGADGGFAAHVLSLPGCVALGGDQNAVMTALPPLLSAWLHFLQAASEPAPPQDAELEISVDEWVVTDARVTAGESSAFFSADKPPLAEAEIRRLLSRLTELRGNLLAGVRRLPDDVLDAGSDPVTLRRVLEELARGQWWLLTRLGASPMGEAPDRTSGRLDAALALVTETFGRLPEPGSRRLDIEGEEWTPRKVMRRLLWLEWSLGQAALSRVAALGENSHPPRR